MSDAKMSPENFSNAIVPGPGNTRKGSGKPIKVAAPVVPTLPAWVSPIQEFQCIVCKLIKKSPTEMHQHQSFSHTSEELSLSIIGLQVLYNIHKSSEKKVITPSKSDSQNMVADLTSDNCKHETPSPLCPPDTNQPAYSEVQKEPMCLKVAISKSVLKTNNSNAQNHGHDLKTHLQANIISSNTPRPVVVSTKKKITAPSSRPKRRKEVKILPAISKKEDLKIQSGSAKIFLKEASQDRFARIDVSQIIRNNIFQRVLTSHSNNGNHLADRTFLVKTESSLASHSKPICLKFSQVDVNSMKVDEVKKPEVISDNSDAIFKKPADFKKPQETIKRPELTIEKIDTNFKKPESVVMKPAVTIKKLPMCTKKPEVIKPNEQISGNQRAGNFTKNLNNLCSDMQNVCLKRPRSESPLRKLEPSSGISTEPPLQKSEPEFIKLHSILKRPVAQIQIVERPAKKLKSLPEVPPEGIKHENVKTKSLPIIEVGDDAWYETVKNKLYLESELPTDITNIAMQDFSNQSFEVSKNASESFNYNDLSSEAFMNLDSYLMPPEIQPQEGLNSTSQGFVDNLTLQNSSQVPAFDYSNADLLFENNQNHISPVDLNENVWNSDGNPVYTELLPVYYS